MSKKIPYLRPTRFDFDREAYLITGFKKKGKLDYETIN